MIAKRIATLLAAVAVTAASPAFAQAAPAPAPESSLDGSAQMEGSSTAAYVVAALVAGALIFGLVKFLDDDDGGDDVPVSP